MASKKRQQSARAQHQSAVRAGEALAAEVLRFRTRQRRRRSGVARQPEAAFDVAAAQLPPASRALFGSGSSAGTLIAEGDSWFNYPFHDVLQMLEDEHGYEVESVAHAGDRVEDMAFSGGQLEEFARRLEKLLRNGKIPRAVLLSGGGNDIAGDQFGMLLNHARSPNAGLNDSVVRGIVDERIRASHVTIISGITAIAQKYLGRPIPIVMHGYDYPVPDGRGFLGGFWMLPGPWLEPGFREKGFDDRATNTRTMQALIDRFNVMLKGVAASFAHVHYIDLRGTLANSSDYKKYWANELHPTERGFRVVAGMFAAVIDKQ
jgi:lysophospholipase L1-like esterase